MKKASFLSEYFNTFASVVKKTNVETLEKIIEELVILKKQHGRLFVLGIGGSASNSSHAVNDFRKIARIESYAATDNTAEITARTNDEGWPTTFVNYLSLNNLSKKDIVMIFSVSGGNFDANKSINIILAANYAQKRKSKIISILGGDGGEVAKMSDLAIFIRSENYKNLTAYTESMQAVIWHAIVNHPKLNTLYRLSEYPNKQL
jgi:D-sedoheptulose 7-phosphate isomerase